MSDSYSVSLQVWHPNADPHSIVRGIGITPKRYWKADDKRKAPNGNELGGTYRESYCLFEFGAAENKELSDFLSETLDTLSKATEFITQFRQTGGKAAFFVSWERGDGRGESFDVALLSRMVEVGIDLGIQPIW